MLEIPTNTPPILYSEHEHYHNVKTNPFVPNAPFLRGDRSFLVTQICLILEASFSNNFLRNSKRKGSNPRGTHPCPVQHLHTVMCCN